MVYNQIMIVFRVDSDYVGLVQTLLLSKKILVYPIASIPNTRNLYTRALFDSVAYFGDINSSPTSAKSNLLFLLECHITGDLQRKK